MAVTTKTLDKYVLLIGSKSDMPQTVTPTEGALTAFLDIDAHIFYLWNSLGWINVGGILPN